MRSNGATRQLVVRDVTSARRARPRYWELMTKGTGPGAQGRSQFPPSRRQTPTPLLTLAHRAPLPVFPAGRLVLVSLLTVHSDPSRSMRRSGLHRSGRKSMIFGLSLCFLTDIYDRQITWCQAVDPGERYAEVLVSDSATIRGQGECLHS